MNDKIIEFNGQKWVDAYLFHLQSKTLPLWQTVTQISSDSIIRMMKIMTAKGIIFAVKQTEWAALSEVEKFTMLSIEGSVVINVNTETGVGELEILDSPEKLKTHIKNWS